MKRFAAVLLLATLSTGKISAEGTNPYNLPDDINATLKQVFTALFNEDFQQADSLLTTLDSQKESIPIVAMAFVVNEWWKMSLNVLETDPEASQPFLDATEVCSKVCKQKMGDKKRSAQAAFAWGTTLGLMTRWSFANHAWITAYIRGNKAVDYCERSLSRHPNVADPYMTIGMINYAKTMLSSYMDSDEAKAAAVLRNEGVQQLRNAADNSVYFQQASRLLLAGILANDAPKEAVPLLRQLHTELPRSAFVHMVLMTSLYNSGNLEDMAVEANAFYDALSTGTYPSTYWPQMYFTRGLISLRNERWKEAASFFYDAAKQASTENPYQTWSHLYRGYALDAWGKRKEALKEYKQVLELRRCFASHDHARARQDSPFVPTDVEMKHLEL